MKEITIKITDEQYRRWRYYMVIKFGKQASLDRIAKTVLTRYVADIAQQEVDRLNQNIDRGDDE